jgi:geranylgeranyl pyrophosphate synthase
MTILLRDARPSANWKDVFSVMRPDLDRVEARVANVAQVNFPAASALVSDIVAAGGKRLRPLILLLAARGYRYTEHLDDIVTAAAGIELLHTASLVHDDTVDRAAIRRGKPTLNSALSSSAAILIGDLLFAHSAMLAAATNSVRVVSIFSSTLGEICDGQLREMFEGQNLDQTREQYEIRTYGKTASLFAGSAEMGAVLGQAPDEQITAIRQYGADLGMAFQIVDDVLDLTGGSSDLGKPAGNDLRQGTVTLPTLVYADTLDRKSDAWRQLQAVVGGQASSDAEVSKVIDAIRASGGIDEAVQAAETYVDRAKAALSATPPSETRDLLEIVADLAVNRAS